MTRRDIKRIGNGESVFTGNIFVVIGLLLLCSILTSLSLFIAWPWLYCWLIGYITKNTHIDGKQLRFDGKGKKIIVWWLIFLVAIIAVYVVYYLNFMKTPEIQAAVQQASSNMVVTAQGPSADIVLYTLALSLFFLVLSMIAVYLIIRWTVANIHMEQTGTAFLSDTGIPDTSAPDTSVLGTYSTWQNN